jgi:hypothetical protein
VQIPKKTYILSILLSSVYCGHRVPETCNCNPRYTCFLIFPLFLQRLHSCAEYLLSAKIKKSVFGRSLLDTAHVISLSFSIYWSTCSRRWLSLATHIGKLPLGGNVDTRSRNCLRGFLLCRSSRMEEMAPFTAGSLPHYIIMRMIPAKRRICLPVVVDKH